MFRSSLLNLCIGSSASIPMATTTFEPPVGDSTQDLSSGSSESNTMITPDSEPATGDKYQDTFHGWMTTSATSPMTYQPFNPKPWEETDVDIRISHCGVCASDLHTMRSGWVGSLISPPTTGDTKPPANHQAASRARHSTPAPSATKSSGT